MEVFASKDAIKPVSLHIYQLHSQKIEKFTVNSEVSSYR